MPVEKTCEHCGKTFTVKPYLAEGKRFCSPACKHAGNRLKLVCTECRTEFWTWKSQVKYRPALFCSKACADKAKRIKKPPKRPKPAPVLKVCETCLSVFRVPPNRKDTARFCSTACKSRNRMYAKECSDRQQGEKSWRWKGGKYKTGEGYIRQKRKRNGKEQFRLSHRVVMAQWMAEIEPEHPFLIHLDGERVLSPDIDIHHVDRDRSNNTRTNLLAVTKAAHAKIHHNGRKPEPWECWPPNPSIW